MIMEEFRRLNRIFSTPLLNKNCYIFTANMVLRLTIDLAIF